MAVTENTTFVTCTLSEADAIIVTFELLRTIVPLAGLVMLTFGGCVSVDVGVGVNVGFGVCVGVGIGV